MSAAIRLQTSSQGSVISEFLLAIVLLVILLAFTVDFSLYLYEQSELSEAARMATRTVIMKSPRSCSSSDCSAERNELSRLVQDVTLSHLEDGGYQRNDYEVQTSFSAEASGNYIHIRVQRQVGRRFLLAPWIETFATARSTARSRARFCASGISTC